MERLILTNYQAPGDIVMLTAAVRDLHLHVPGRFLTDVRTSCPVLWQHNPHLTRLAEDDSRVRVMACHYPLIHDANDRPVHFLLGFIEFLNAQLDLDIRLTRKAGDLHLSRLEKAQPSLVEQQTGVRAPYWIVVAGGKYDFTIKWWHFRRWREGANRPPGKSILPIVSCIRWVLCPAAVEADAGGHASFPWGMVKSTIGRSTSVPVWSRVCLPACGSLLFPT